MSSMTPDKAESTQLQLETTSQAPEMNNKHEASTDLNETVVVDIRSEVQEEPAEDSDIATCLLRIELLRMV